MKPSNVAEDAFFEETIKLAYDFADAIPEAQDFLKQTKRDSYRTLVWKKRC